MAHFTLLNLSGVQEILRLFSCSQEIIQSTTFCTISLLSTFLSFSQPYLCCQSGNFYSGFCTNNLYSSLITSLCCSCPYSHTFPELTFRTPAVVRNEKAPLSLIPFLLPCYFHRSISYMLSLLMLPTATGKMILITYINGSNLNYYSN
jgi:hypothetical protein